MALPSSETRNPSAKANRRQPSESHAAIRDRAACGGEEWQQHQQAGGGARRRHMQTPCKATASGPRFVRPASPRGEPRHLRTPKADKAPSRFRFPHVDCLRGTRPASTSSTPGNLARGRTRVSHLARSHLLPGTSAIHLSRPPGQGRGAAATWNSLAPRAEVEGPEARQPIRDASLAPLLSVAEDHRWVLSRSKRTRRPSLLSLTR